MGNNYDGDQLQFDINVEESFDSKLAGQYWEMSLYVVSLWSTYRGRCKLYNNYSNPRTKHKVRRTVDEYYHGPNALMRTINSDAQELKWAIKSLESLCIKLGVKPISWAWLEGNVPDSKYAESYKGKIETKIKSKAPPIYIGDLPPYQPRPKKH